MGQFKYQDQLDACLEKPCPGRRYEERECIGFRWVHQPLWADDFDPPALASPRSSRPKTEEYRRTCGNYALSFFKSAEHARRRWNNMKGAYDVETLFGTHAVEIELNGDDGRSSKPSGSFKHFDLHEYNGQRRWPARIKSATPLREDEEDAESC